jgi:hypothetical protein
VSSDVPGRPVVRASDAEREAVVSRPQIEMVGEPAQAGAVSSVVGDVRLVPSAGIPERVSTVFGDVEVVVGEGVAAEIEGWTVFGDRKTQLAPAPRLAGTPRVVVRAWTVFGDLRLPSLPPGEDPRPWRAVLDRFAARRPPPPPPR